MTMAACASQVVSYGRRKNIPVREIKMLIKENVIFHRMT